MINCFVRRPIRQHFIPTLDQMKYEVEDGYTAEGTQVRYGYDERIFPNFSWRGYAILMNIQVCNFLFILTFQGKVHIQKSRIDSNCSALCDVVSLSEFIMCLLKYIL